MNFLWLLLLIAGIVGYVMNIMDLAAKVGWEAVIRIFGLVIPFIGAIAGYF
jgi:hypothetical protein